MGIDEEIGTGIDFDRRRPSPAGILDDDQQATRRLGFGARDEQTAIQLGYVGPAAALIQLLAPPTDPEIRRAEKFDGAADNHELARRPQDRRHVSSRRVHATVQDSGRSCGFADCRYLLGHATRGREHQQSGNHLAPFHNESMIARCPAVNSASARTPRGGLG